MTFLKELMRRNVFKVGTAYAVVAWILIQGAAILLPTFSAPRWVMPVFSAIVIAGFPIAIVLAWAFELTPQGVRRTEALATPPPKSVPPEEAPRPAAISTVPSIAVLPFADMSPDKDQEYFADGITEELLNRLARLKGLHVTGRTSSFHFKGKNEDLRVIGETLGVANILEGSVRKSGDRVRITAQLVKSADGYHLWSDTYDQTLDDIFTLEDEIAGTVARALSITLGVGDLDHIAGMTRNVEAYDAYLFGRQILLGLVSRDLLRSRIDSLERAVRLDPSFALAWAALARAYEQLGVRYDDPARADHWLKKAAHALSRAVDLVPDATEVLSQCIFDAIRKRDWIGADRLCHKAADRYGDSGLLLGSYHFLAIVGKLPRFVDRLEDARRIEPLNAEIGIPLAMAYFLAGRPADALAECDRIDSFGEVHTNLRGGALMIALSVGDHDEILHRIDALVNVDESTGQIHAVMRNLLDDAPAGLAELRRTLSALPSVSLQQFVVIGVWAAYFGDAAMALDAWKNIVAQHGLPTLGHIAWQPLFRDMRRLPDFKVALRDLGLVDYWRATGDWGDFCRPLGDDDFECV